MFAAAAAAAGEAPDTDAGMALDPNPPNPPVADFAPKADVEVVPPKADPDPAPDAVAPKAEAPNADAVCVVCPNGFAVAAEADIAPV